MYYRILRAIAIVSALATTAGRGGAEFLTNSPAWNGTDQVAAFGEPNTATYGQTITVGPDHFLNSFSFNLKSNSGDKVDFRAYVYAWDGSKASGSALYTSANNSLAANTSTFQNFSYNAGGIDLTVGSEYVLFLSASELFDAVVGDASAGYTISESYAGGSFVYLNSGNDIGQVTTTPWETSIAGTPNRDLAFTASLSDTAPPTVVTPLPPTLLAGFLGMAMLAGVRRLRRT